MRVLIPTDEVLSAVALCTERNKQALRDIGSVGWWEGDPCQFVGALTIQVAAVLNQPQQRVRNRLHMMRRHGIVKSHRITGGSTIRWYPLPPKCQCHN